MYQISNLLSDGIAEMADTYGSKLIVMADLLGTFNEPETRENEVARLLDAIRSGITEAKKRLVVIVTLSSPNRHDGLVDVWSGTLVDVSLQRDGRLRAELLKHPTMRPAASEFTISGMYRPDGLLEGIR